MSAWDQIHKASLGAVALLIDFRFYELRQVSQRLLPAEVTRLLRDDIRQAFLDDVYLGTDGYLLQCHRHLKLTRQVGVVELIGVAQAFIRYELHILAAERVTVAGCEISEGHPMSATDFPIKLMHGACKAVGRQPLR